MEKIIFRIDFEIFKRKLIKVLGCMIFLCFWMFIPNFLGFPENENIINVKTTLLAMMSGLFVFLFEILKRKAQIIESNICCIIGFYNYSVFTNKFQTIVFMISFFVLYIVYYLTIKIVVEDKVIKFYEFGVRKAKVNFLEKEVLMDLVSYQRMIRNSNEVTVEVLRAFKKVKYFGKRMILQESVDWINVEDKEKLRDILSESIVLKFHA